MSSKMAIALLAKRLQEIRIPQAGEKIYKDECAFSFDTPESETGLYVCMSTFLGFGKGYVERHYRKTGHAVYLHMRRLKHEIPVERAHGVEEKKVTRLAIGVEGGFDLEAGKKYEYEDINSICVLPEFAYIPLPNAELPEKVQVAVNAILHSESASVVEAAQQASIWDGEKRPVTKHAENLVQLDNGVKIPPRNWKCEQCDMMENLWLNLTDGAVLCGRSYHDGSGGNNHAVKHYQNTMYPLAVKLGTITPESADVYSYDEDDMVEDPYLQKHLAHFGINVAQMVKTDKSMTELEIDINKRFGEWDTIQEAGSQLVPLYGPGYTGLSNLGNSCYLNSVIQVIFSIPDFQKRYGEYADDIFEKAPINPNDDFNVQMAKLGRGLLCGRYSIPPPPGSDPERKANEVHNGIRPTMFKSLIGKGHVEFSTKRQQDAQEFFLHLVNVLERHSRGQPNPAECFKFQVEERVQCLGSNRVKYSHTPEYILRVPIPLDAALNKDEVADYEKKKKERNDGQLQVVRARIPFTACLETMAGQKLIHDFYSDAIQGTTSAVKTYRFATFPDYLMIQLEKFTFEDGWIPKKLDVCIDVPDELDLSILRGHGQQPGEELMPDPQAHQQPVSDAPAFRVDEAVLSNLMDMGFPLDACRRALYNIGSNDLEGAVNWLTEHIADPDFAAPFTIPASKSSTDSTAGPVPDSASIDVIVSMGFNRDQAIKALKNADNNVERAIDWIFSHISELESSEPKTELHLPPPPQFRDGSSRYRLVAFISHMGTSTMVGHYVCHIFKDGRWVIFNDNKVAVSENPPKDLGYLYLYQRI